MSGSGPVADSLRTRPAGSGTVISRTGVKGSSSGSMGVTRQGHAGGNGRNGSPSNGRKKTATGKVKLWSPWKLILFSIAMGIAGSMYLTHVFQTQNTLREVQELRRDHERAHRIYTDTRRNFDRATGPSEVYRRAESMGMVTGGAMDPVIVLPK
ncbi:hypothetical protein QA596_07975 [Balneolales bacterium ANBcel1]|nr:hypothetical protein [Balneolales bacterium ANBcel1]